MTVMAPSLACSHCGKDTILRTETLTLVERVLDQLFISPFRCQTCSHRFRAFRLGRGYPAQVLDRREHSRIPVRLWLAFAAGKTDGTGTVINLSVGGCLIETDHILQPDELYRLEIRLSEHLPPIEATAKVRSLRGRHAGMKFVCILKGGPLLLEFLKARTAAPESPNS
jgi:hypothetical protein